ncbi:MAG: hypothetical protein J7647_04105 [Cyanobacteria bacterium SBLK]|nr:hypothetical protein [Cyanobacteria bacterium SBLK]
MLFPNIWGFKGGIQVYSRILWQTLRALYPEVTCDVFLKYDRQTDIATVPERTRFHCFGHLSRWQQSLGLAISVLTRGIRQRPTLAIATHLNYGIVLYWLEFLTGTPYWIVVHGLEGWNLNHPLRVKALQNAERGLPSATTPALASSKNNICLPIA